MSTRLLRLIVATIVLSAFPVLSNAQIGSFEFGGATFASSTPHPSGHACAILGMDTDPLFNISCVSLHGNGSGQVVYSVYTGAARVLQQWGNFTIYGNAEGGITEGSTASALFNGGLGVGYAINPTVQLVLTAQASDAPSLPTGWQPLITGGIRIGARTPAGALSAAQKAMRKLTKRLRAPKREVH